MKYISCFLLAIIFCLAGICTSSACVACDPCTPINKDTTAAKKSPVKIPATVVQPANKPTAKKQQQKTNNDNGSPFSWRPTLLY